MDTNGNKKVEWVSELIGDDYMDWFGRFILLGCGTGRGKTYFALNVYVKWLLTQGKTVLYLCNRKKLEEQIDYEIEEYGLTDEEGFEKMSYQAMKEYIEHGFQMSYDVYICDEAHFFLADAGFNLYTDIPYFYILSHINATVVYMTATYWNIEQRLRKDLANRSELIPYYLPTDYSYVKKICWYKSQNDLYGIIDRILRNRPDDKVIYFCNSNDKMKQLHDHYDPSHGKSEDESLLKESKLQYMGFICSDGTKNKWMLSHCFDLVTEIDNETNKKKQTLVPKYDLVKVQTEKGGYEGYTFERRVLVSTKVIDNGIDFNDRAIKHIILDVFDIESALQCLGRKRCQGEDDTCVFYIRDWQSRQMNVFLQQAESELESPRLFLEDYYQWLERFGSDRESKDKTIYYDHNEKSWKVNPLRYDKLVEEEKLIVQMKDKHTSYREIITDRIGDIARERSVDIENLKADIVKTDLYIWLEKHANKLLSDKEKSDLIKLCKLTDRYGRKLTGAKSIFPYVEDYYKGFQLQSKRVIENGEKVTRWELTQKNKSGKDEDEKVQLSDI